MSETAGFTTFGVSVVLGIVFLVGSCQITNSGVREEAIKAGLSPLEVACITGERPSWCDLLAADRCDG